MKQRITLDEVYSLNEKQKARLYDIYSMFGDKERILTETHPANGSLPLLTIGQMIEIIGDDYINVLMEYDNGNPAWVEHVCDALWEAVKEILEREI